MQVQAHEQAQVQAQVRVFDNNHINRPVNNHNHINCDNANSIHMISYCIYGVDTDQKNGCGIDNGVPVLARVLYCGMLQVEYNIKAYNVVCGMIRL